MFNTLLIHRTVTKNFHPSTCHKILKPIRKSARAALPRVVLIDMCSWVSINFCRLVFLLASVAQRSACVLCIALDQKVSSPRRPQPWWCTNHTTRGTFQRRAETPSVGRVAVISNVSSPRDKVYIVGWSEIALQKHNFLRSWSILKLWSLKEKLTFTKSFSYSPRKDTELPTDLQSDNVTPLVGTNLNGSFLELRHLMISPIHSTRQIRLVGT